MGFIEYLAKKNENGKVLKQAKKLTAMALLTGLLVSGSGCQNNEKENLKTDEFGNVYVVYNPENLSEKEICHGQNKSEFHVLDGNEVDIYGKDYRGVCEDCGKELKKPYEDHNVKETHPVIVKGFLGYWILPGQKGTCENCGQEVYRDDLVVEEPYPMH